MPRKPRRAAPPQEPPSPPPSSPPSPPQERRPLPDDAVALAFADDGRAVTGDPTAPPVAPETRVRGRPGRPPGSKNKAPTGDDALKAEDLGGLHEGVGDLLGKLPGFAPIDPEVYGRLNRLGVPVWRRLIKNGGTLATILYAVEAGRVYLIELVSTIVGWFSGKGDEATGLASTPDTDADEDDGGDSTARPVRNGGRPAAPVVLTEPDNSREPFSRDVGV